MRERLHNLNHHGPYNRPYLTQIQALFLLDTFCFVVYNPIMIANKLSQHEAETLTRCRLAEFAPVLALLGDERDQALVALTRTDEPMNIYRLQGRIAFIESFLKAVEHAGKRHTA